MVSPILHVSEHRGQIDRYSVRLHVADVDVTGTEVASPGPDVAEHLFVQSTNEIRRQNINGLEAATTIRLGESFGDIGFFRRIEILTIGNP
jgi:hypothetical protein